jgi:hypothetical protein
VKLPLSKNGLMQETRIIKFENKLFAMKALYLLSFIALSLLTSCYYDSEEDLYTVCDTTNVTFSGTVHPILEANCSSCHNASVAEAGIITETHNDLILHVNSGIFWKAINHEPGATPMPYNQPKMQQCDLLKIKAWINQGAPNN